MQRGIIVVLMLTLLIATVVAPAQTITGTVLEQGSNEVLIGVNIISNNQGTSTDINGKYIFQLSPGLHTITYKYIGYENQIKEINVTSESNLIINIELKSSSEKLSTVVVSAGKFNQRIEETTISMEVIKPSLIENKNTTNIKSAMEQIPGLNITDGQANIRGGSGWSYGTGTRVLVLVDDMPLISGDAGQVQWNLIATENINQVEVIKGAASALYGSSALNGVVNIRTSYPKQSEIDKNPKPGFTKLNMNFGLIDFPRRDELNWNGEKRRAFKGLEFLQSYKMPKLDLSIGGNLFLDDGYRQGEKTNRKRFNLNSLYKSEKIKGLSYGLNANFLFQNTASVIIWDSYDRAYIPLNGELTNTNGDTYNVDPYATFIIGNNRHTLRTRFLKVINDNSTIGDTINNVNRSKSYYSDYQWQKDLEKINLSFTMGTTNEIIFANSKIFQGSNSRRNHALYTQFDKKIGKLNISSGARFEYFSLNSEVKHVINGDSINNFAIGRPVFRAGINYELSPSTFLRSSWGQGYRFPSMAELFVTTNASGIEIYANPELKPERGWSSEIAIKQKLKIHKWNGFIDVAAFVMKYNDMMEFTFGQWGDPITMPLYGLGFKSVNIGETQISGIELSINGQGKINNDLKINLIGGYTYMNPVALEPDKVYTESIGQLVINGETIGPELTYNNSSSDPSILKYRYQHIAKIDIEFLYQDFLFGTSLRYNDFMRNIDKIFTDEWINQELIPGINEAREKYRNGDFIIDLRVGYNIDKNSKVSLIINNLLNEEYMSRPADMRPPRTIACQLSFKI
jgi:iron complex outermembrane receptor protein